jgi:hypothetical protein
MNKFNWKMLFTPKFVHAFVVDITGIARTLVIGYIFYSINLKWSLILGTIIAANFAARILLNRAYLKEKEENVRQYAQVMKQMTDKVERKEIGNDNPQT